MRLLGGREEVCWGISRTRVSDNAPASMQCCIGTQLVPKLPALLHRKFCFFPDSSSLQLLKLDDVCLDVFLRYAEVFVGCQICDFQRKITNSLRNWTPNFLRKICKPKTKLHFTLSNALLFLVAVVFIQDTTVQSSDCLPHSRPNPIWFLSHIFFLTPSSNCP